MKTGNYLESVSPHPLPLSLSLSLSVYNPNMVQGSGKIIVHMVSVCPPLLALALTRQGLLFAEDGWD